MKVWEVTEKTTMNKGHTMGHVLSTAPPPVVGFSKNNSQAQTGENAQQSDKSTDIIKP